ncbi:MAG TPA: hypothetical protein VGG20_05170, partial [Thermoanaerobaculia bacterium]
MTSPKRVEASNIEKDFVYYFDAAKTQCAGECTINFRAGGIAWHPFPWGMTCAVPSLQEKVNQIRRRRLISELSHQRHHLPAVIGGVVHHVDDRLPE